MTKFLIRIFVKDYKNVKDPSTRGRYGRLAAIVGIATNVLLSGLKIAVGLLFGSIAILADGINNLSDASSSIILLIGIKLAAKPADNRHPYGHARIEYLTGLLISVLIIILGIQLLITSVKKITVPEPVTFNWITIFVLLAAIAIKVWQALFYRKVGDTIGSSTIKATGTDSRNDVIATSGVLLSLIIGKLSGIQTDGFMGAIVALFIIWSGIQLVGETAAPLLGSPPDPELVKEIQDRIRANEGVIGIHDLVVHSYGPGRTFASVHVEVDSRDDLIACHDMVDNIERSISRDLKIELVIHMDPLDPEDPLTAEINKELNKITASIEGVIGHHDLRVVTGYTHQNIVFDIVVDRDLNMKESELIKLLDDKIKQLSPNYYTVITVDQCYTKQ